MKGNVFVSFFRGKEMAGNVFWINTLKLAMFLSSVFPPFLLYSLFCVLNPHDCVLFSLSVFFKKMLFPFLTCILFSVFFSHLRASACGSSEQFVC